jgi:hypothetical protein
MDLSQSAGSGAGNRTGLADPVPLDQSSAETDEIWLAPW